MKKLINAFPFVMSILLIGYSTYVYFSIKGFKIFEINSSIGMFYARTYKYSAVIGITVFLIYGVLFIIKAKGRKKAEE